MEYISSANSSWPTSPASYGWTYFHAELLGTIYHEDNVVLHGESWHISQEPSTTKTTWCYMDRHGIYQLAELQLTDVTSVVQLNVFPRWAPRNHLSRSQRGAASITKPTWCCIYHEANVVLHLPRSQRGATWIVMVYISCGNSWSAWWLHWKCSTFFHAELSATIRFQIIHTTQRQTRCWIVMEYINRVNSWWSRWLQR